MAKKKTPPHFFGCVDGIWYMIPSAKRKKFMELILIGEDAKDFSEFEYEFDEYILKCDIADINFIPQND